MGLSLAFSQKPEGKSRLMSDEPMSTAMMIETPDGIAELLRESVEADRELSASVRAVMLQATVACVEELKRRWNAE